MSRVKVSVVIVSFNSLPALTDCLQSLEAGCRSVAYELILVDNNSEDDSVPVTKQLFPQARIIKLPRNQGFGAACNVAAKTATGEFLLFLNPDLILDEFAVKYLVEAVVSNQNYGAAGGRLRFADDSFQATCRDYPSIENILFSRGSVLSCFLPKSNRYTLPDYKDITVVPAISGALMLIRRSLFERVVGFDERFFMFVEDTELCHRISLAGFKNIFVPQAGGIHNWGTGSNASRIKRSWYHHHSMWKYFIKYIPNGFSLFFLPLLLVANFTLAMLKIALTTNDTRLGTVLDSKDTVEPEEKL